MRTVLNNVIVWNTNYHIETEAEIKAHSPYEIWAEDLTSDIVARLDALLSFKETKKFGDSSETLKFTIGLNLGPRLNGKIEVFSLSDNISVEIAAAIDRFIVDRGVKGKVRVYGLDFSGRHCYYNLIYTMGK